MTGPEHYREAERLIENWQATVNEIPEDVDADDLAAQLKQGADLAQQTLACAQVHATLALVAVQVNTEHESLWAETVTS